MDGFCASVPQQRGQHNPNVDYVPYEQMKERILKIVDDFHGWVKVATCMNKPGVKFHAFDSQVLLIRVFFLITFSEFHSLFSVFVNSSQTQSETTQESTSFSWAWRRWAPHCVIMCKYSVFSRQHMGIFRDIFHFYAECDGGQLYLLHIRVRTFKIYHFYWAVFEPFNDSSQWFLPAHL